jgi:FkbM family methyltransferase
VSNLTYLERMIGRLGRKQGKVRIVQVGAFDGVAGDPLRQWVLANKSKNEILLIEPQPEAVKRLTVNYASHPGATILECAISLSPLEKITMYSRENKGWGSGSSCDLANHRLFCSNRGIAPDNFRRFEVDCMTLEEALNKSGFGRDIDVIQVDCEGYDDQVLYACSLAKLEPKIINYEYSLLSADRRQNLRVVLKNLNYELKQWSSRDECGILSKTS